MDLRQLSYVVAVVDEGGMTRAAAAIGVAQPTLSQAIRSLEAELGVELFHRRAHGAAVGGQGSARHRPAGRPLRDAATARRGGGRGRARGGTGPGEPADARRARSPS
ncbi:MAG: LysR family transcriptional regulator [Acidimicrobiales bacterium]